MPQTPLSNAPLPAGSDAALVHVDMKKYADYVDPLLNLKAADEAERNARYSDAPVGTIVCGTERRAIWRKHTDGAWDTIWSKTDWERMTMMNGVTEAQGVYWKRIGEIVYWRGAIVLPSGYSAGSNLAWMNVPADARPVANRQRFSVSMAAAGGTNAVYWCSDGQMFLYCNPSTASWLPVDMSYAAV